ncbi:uncharacterized protein LOC119871211 isoform X7 [Canis lupus familiaris]|uniref:uncharacterized protein LOC119871211 isoform X7 n=1 Tax=Canis lupus familiaris TaxID=9615 RepID=UPI0018F7956B|nr:uncharacterized protein LOC119871211 isoform X7 [Canis lupus familiaris]
MSQRPSLEAQPRPLAGNCLRLPDPSGREVRQPHSRRAQGPTCARARSAAVAGHAALLSPKEQHGRGRSEKRHSPSLGSEMRTRSTERCCGLDAGAPTTQGKGDQLSRAAAKGGSSIQVLASSVPPERHTQPHHRVSATPKKTQHPTQNMLPWDKTPLTLPSSEGR